MRGDDDSGMVGAVERAERRASEAEQHIAQVMAAAARLPYRPKVYFEEWDEPPISAIQWVAELIRIAGGDDIFPELAAESLGKARILVDPDEVIRRAPDLIIGSWCGKKFRPEQVAARPGWDNVPHARNQRVERLADLLGELELGHLRHVLAAVGVRHRHVGAARHQLDLRGG